MSDTEGAKGVDARASYERDDETFDSANDERIDLLRKKFLGEHLDEAETLRLAYTEGYTRGYMARFREEREKVHRDILALADEPIPDGIEPLHPPDAARRIDEVVYGGGGEEKEEDGNERST